MQKFKIVIIVSLLVLSIYATKCYCEYRTASDLIVRTKLLAIDLDDFPVDMNYSTTVYFTVRNHLLEIEGSRNGFFFGWIHNQYQKNDDSLEDRLSIIKAWKKRFDIKWHNGEDR